MPQGIPLESRLGSQLLKTLQHIHRVIPPIPHHRTGGKGIEGCQNLPEQTDLGSIRRAHRSA
jgi:hypothetical protein